MIVLPQTAFVPGQVVNYETAARIACEQLGIHPDTPMPILPNGWEQFGARKLDAQTSYDGSLQIKLAPAVTPAIMMPAWQVMARYIEINRAVLFALRKTGCPSTLLDNAHDASTHSD